MYSWINHSSPFKMKNDNHNLKWKGKNWLQLNQFENPIVQKFEANKEFAIKNHIDFVMITLRFYHRLLLRFYLDFCLL